VAERKAITDYFFTAGGQPLPVGFLLKNSNYADPLSQIANGGSEAFYKGDIAQAIVDTVQNDPQVPGKLSMSDMAAYKALERKPVCGPFKQYTACGAALPSSGGLSVLNILGVLEAKRYEQWSADSAEFVHHFADASKLAFADRNRFMADPDFVDVPTQALLNPSYWKQRAGLIREGKTLAKFPAGTPAASSLVSSESPALPSTSHLSVIDAAGNAVSMTTSIESGFGSRLFVKGFLLNNQLTDFSFTPVDEARKNIANRVQAGKRPRSSMSPFIVFDDKQQVKMLIGSPGGSQIILYVARVIANVLGQNNSLEEAIARPHIVAKNNGSLVLEKGGFSQDVHSKLSQWGHVIKERDLNSGLHGIVVEKGTMIGVADPRREGAARGR
jgi:gamma-glutamyltranspeptidase/glutathione hydrolase